MLELVSGSEAFRAEYDRLQAKQKEAEAKLRACFSNKKNVVAERKAKGDQKAEAERHLQHAKELVGFWGLCVHCDPGQCSIAVTPCMSNFERQLDTEMLVDGCVVLPASLCVCVMLFCCCGILVSSMCHFQRHLQHTREVTSFSGLVCVAILASFSFGLWHLLYCCLPCGTWCGAPSGAGPSVPP